MEEDAAGRAPRPDGRRVLKSRRRRDVGCLFNIDSNFRSALPQRRVRNRGWGGTLAPAEEHAVRDDELELARVVPDDDGLRSCLF